MLKELATIEETLMELCEKKDFLAQHPEIKKITEKYQDFLGTLYDSGIMG